VHEDNCYVLQNIIGSITGALFYQLVLISRCWQRYGLCSAFALTSCAHSLRTATTVPTTRRYSHASTSEREWEKSYVSHRNTKQASEYVSFRQASIPGHATLSVTVDTKLYIDSSAKNCSASRRKARKNHEHADVLHAHPTTSRDKALTHPKHPGRQMWISLKNGTAV
jgi:hypothetical protein